MKAPILAALIVLSVLVAPATAVQDAGDMQVQQFEQTRTPTNVEFDTGLYTVTHGEVAELAVEFTDADEATVVIGDDEEDLRYNLVATVTDGNGDGTVTLMFDTAAAHTAEQTIEVADESDGLTIKDEVSTDTPLRPRDYDLAIYEGDELEHLSTLSISSSLEASVTEASKEIAPEENQPIEIQTNLDPGTAVNVQIQSSTSIENPFVESREVTVREDGTVAPTFDFDGIENNIEADVKIMSNEQMVGDTFSVIGESSGQSPTKSASDDSSTPGQPGFGVPVAVIGLLAAVFMSRK